MVSRVTRGGGRLHYAIPLETLEIDDDGQVQDGAAVVIHVPTRRVSFRDCRECAPRDAHAAPVVASCSGESIVSVERDVLYLKVLRLTACLGGMRGDTAVITLCLQSHTARDTCYQLLALVRPASFLWFPLRQGPPANPDGTDAPTTLVVDDCCSIPVSEAGVLVKRVHCCLIHTSAVQPSAQYLADCMRGLVSKKSGLYAVCLRGDCVLDDWTTLLPQVLPGYTVLSAQTRPAHPIDGIPDHPARTTFILLVDQRFSHAVTHVATAAFEHPHSTTLAVSLRAHETSLALVAHFFSPQWAGTAQTVERARACKRVLSTLKLCNPELDIFNQFDHVFWIGQYEATSDEPPSTSIVKPPPLLGPNATGVWFRCISAPAVGLSYTFADPYEGDPHTPPPLSVVYEIPMRLPCLSAFTPVSLVIEFEYIELHCRGVPSLPAVSLVFYPTGPFASYAGSKVKPLERGQKVHTWAKHELPRMEVAAGYPMEYVRRQLVHICVRDVESSAACNLVGVASADLSELPPPTYPMAPVFAQISAPYIRHDTVWGHMLVALTVSPAAGHEEAGVALPMNVGLPARHDAQRVHGSGSELADVSQSQARGLGRAAPDVAPNPRAPMAAARSIHDVQDDQRAPSPPRDLGQWAPARDASRHAVRSVPPGPPMPGHAVAGQTAMECAGVSPFPRGRQGHSQPPLHPPAATRATPDSYPDIHLPPRVVPRAQLPVLPRSEHPWGVRTGGPLAPDYMQDSPRAPPVTPHQLPPPQPPSQQPPPSHHRHSAWSIPSPAHPDGGGGTGHGASRAPPPASEGTRHLQQVPPPAKAPSGSANVSSVWSAPGEAHARVSRGDCDSALGRSTRYASENGGGGALGSAWLVADSRSASVSDITAHSGTSGRGPPHNAALPQPPAPDVRRKDTAEGDPATPQGGLVCARQSPPPCAPSLEPPQQPPRRASSVASSEWDEEVAFQCMIDKDDSGRLGLMLAEDLSVARVSKGGGAARAGVACGMRVCSVNHTVVRSTSEYFAALAASPSRVHVVLSCPSKMLPKGHVPPDNIQRPQPHARPAQSPVRIKYPSMTSMLASPVSDGASLANWNLCPTPDQPKVLASAVTMQF